MVAVLRMATKSTQVRPDLGTQLSTDTDPWVADLHGGGDENDCQSTIGFDTHPCDGTPRFYVELETLGYSVANPRWEGKLCRPCLAGWVEWEEEEPASVRVISVNPIIAGD